MKRTATSIAMWVALGAAVAAAAQKGIPQPSAALARNLLLDAKISGNLHTYNKGLRGQLDHMIYDPQKQRFVKDSQYHEYGIGFRAALGIVPESAPAWWMAEWPQPVEANRIVLSGGYPNQPQPDTAWKIELRQNGRWIVHARGVGGWYDAGRYEWGGPEIEPIRFDALRVSVFSKDERTPIASIHFRGEPGVSWIVALVPSMDARIVLKGNLPRAGLETELEAQPLTGNITFWQWDFGDGTTGQGRTVSHAWAEPGNPAVRLTFSDGRRSMTVEEKLRIGVPVSVQMVPLDKPVIAREPAAFEAQATFGSPDTFSWDFGDGRSAKGQRVQHTFDKPGIYQVAVTASAGRFADSCQAIVRVHTPETLHVPQVFLDTDQKNEVDDQHYLGYALFSDLDILGVNSVHHGGGQEPVNYEEIVHVLDLARQSGLPESRVPSIFRGANERLTVPPSGKWDETPPIDTAASRAILAAARGASPTNPVWVVPVGPGTNVASAILLAGAEGLDLRGRIRVLWLGGTHEVVHREFNGRNDPWSMYVIAQSNVETWFMPAPVGARVAINRDTEMDLYPGHPLGRYLRDIVAKWRRAEEKIKPLFDPSCLAAIISMRLDLGWILEVERISVAGPDRNYAYSKSDAPNAVYIIRQIDSMAMRNDIFETLKGRKTPLIGRPPAGTQSANMPAHREAQWRTLPLISGGKVDPAWVQVGWGGFVVDGDALRTECDQRGMGLIFYKPEKFGNCQIRIVYRPETPKSNAGVFVRIDDGILARAGEKSPPVQRDEKGKLAKDMLAKIQEAAERELGGWYPVNHGYEVQIMDAGDPFHRTGSVYSLSRAADLPLNPRSDWRTMIITLDGDRILVDVDGQRISSFDPGASDNPPRKNWTEPKREPKRPLVGYIGLQNHDPGDVVWFKEISVRPLWQKGQ